MGSNPIITIIITGTNAKENKAKAFKTILKHVGRPKVIIQGQPFFVVSASVLALTGTQTAADSVVPAYVCACRSMRHLDAALQHELRAPDLHAFPRFIMAHRHTCCIASINMFNLGSRSFSPLNAENQRGIVFPGC